MAIKMAKKNGIFKTLPIKTKEQAEIICQEYAKHYVIANMREAQEGGYVVEYGYLKPKEDKRSTKKQQSSRLGEV